METRSKKEVARPNWKEIARPNERVDEKECGQLETNKWNQMIVYVNSIGDQVRARPGTCIMHHSTEAKLHLCSDVHVGCHLDANAIKDQLAALKKHHMWSDMCVRARAVVWKPTGDLHGHRMNYYYRSVLVGPLDNVSDYMMDSLEYLLRNYLGRYDNKFSYKKQKVGVKRSWKR